MSSRDDVLIINQSTAADVNRFLGVLLQDCDLPWIFTEFTVTIDVHWIFDATVDALSVADAALSKVGVSRWLRGTESRTTTANVACWALLWTSSVVCLTLSNENVMVSLDTGGTKWEYWCDL